MNITVLQDSFNRGELTPKVHYRADEQFYLDGLKTLTNFVSVPRGAVTRRTGFRYLEKVALPDTTVYVLPQIADIKITTPTVQVTT